MQLLQWPKWTLALDVIQKDLNKLEDWDLTELLKFSKAKCKILHHIGAVPGNNPG